MKKHPIAPEHTAVRTALWRALHVLIDETPHVFVDEVGEKIVGEKNWRERPDMNADFSKSIEDLVEEEMAKGITQYVILGAGLDTFALRRTELMDKLHVFEVDQPGPQKWKEQRIKELGINAPSHLHFVPVDFEAGESWMQEAEKVGFDKNLPTVIVSTGVSLYLSKETNFEILKELASLPHKSVFAMTFMLALDLLKPHEQELMKFVMARAEESGTPFLSLFAPDEIISLAKKASFKEADYISAKDIFERYFAKRSDGLDAGEAEAFLVART